MLLLPVVCGLVRILLPAHPGSLVVHLLYPPEAPRASEAGLRGALQSHPRSRGERVTQERRDQKGTEVNEEGLNRESGCDGRGRECRVSLLTAFASFTSRTARREGNRMMNVEREARQAKEGSKVGCISQPFTAPWFGCPLPGTLHLGAGFLSPLSASLLHLSFTTSGSVHSPYGSFPSPTE